MELIEVKKTAPTQKDDNLRLIAEENPNPMR